MHLQYNSIKRSSTKVRRWTKVNKQCKKICQQNKNEEEIILRKDAHDQKGWIIKKDWGRKKASNRIETSKISWKEWKKIQGWKEYSFL